MYVLYINHLIVESLHNVTYVRADKYRYELRVVDTSNTLILYNHHIVPLELHLYLELNA